MNYKSAANDNVEPGGYIQWMEPDHGQTQVLHRKAGAPSAATKELYKHTTKFFQGIAIAGGRGLANLLQGSGWEVVAEEAFATDQLLHETTYFSTMITQMSGPIAMKILSETKFKTKEQVDQMISNAVEELQNGDIYTHFELYVVVARKNK